jgi:hypothetical protein
MAEAYMKLYQGQPGVAAGVVYTVPAATNAVIKHIRAVNTSTATAVTIGLFDGGSTADKRILPDVVLQPGEWLEWDGLITMPTGATLQAIASVATTVTLTIYGLQLT